MRIGGRGYMDRRTTELAEKMVCGVCTGDVHQVGEVWFHTVPPATCCPRSTSTSKSSTSRRFTTRYEPVDGQNVEQYWYDAAEPPVRLTPESVRVPFADVAVTLATGWTP